MTAPFLPKQVTPIPKKRTAKRGGATAWKKKATKKWGEYVHARDRVCQVCGRGDVKLDAHHIMPRTYPATRALAANGLLLCVQHHTGRDGVHSDPQMALELYHRVLGVDGYERLRAMALAGAKTSVDFWKEQHDVLTKLLEARRG